MLSTSERTKRCQARLRLEELESRNLLSLLGLHATVVVAMSLEPTASATISLDTTAQPSQSLDPVTVSASGGIVQNQATSHVDAILDVSVVRDLTTHVQILERVPEGVQSVFKTITTTVEQTVTRIVQTIDNSVPPPINDLIPVPVVPPGIPGLPPVVPPVTPEPLPVGPPVNAPPVPVTTTPGPEPTTPVLPVVTTGLTVVTPPSSAGEATSPTAATTITTGGSTTLPPNQTSQVQSAGVADTGDVPVVTETVPALSPSAGTSGLRVESGGGDEATPPDWLVPMPRINEESGTQGVGTDNKSAQARTAEALQACDACFVRESLKRLATDEGGTATDAGRLGWLLDPGTAFAALALAVGGFEWGVRSDETDRRNRRLLRI